MDVNKTNSENFINPIFAKTLENIGNEKVKRDKTHDKKLLPVILLKTRNKENKSDIYPIKVKIIYKE